MLLIYIIVSLLLLLFLLNNSIKYGLFHNLYSSVIGILCVILDIIYLGLLNPKSKVYFLNSFFELHSSTEYFQYIIYFTGFMALSLFFMLIIFGLLKPRSRR